MVLLAFLFASSMSGQDIHLSQPDFSPLNISPGYAGLFAEDLRFMGSYRSQWQSVPVPYLTFSGAADMKVPSIFKKNNKIALAGGVLFNYDQSGDSELTLSSFGVNGAIHYKINDQQTLSLGVQSMATQRAFSIANLQFNNQYNGDIFDPSKDSKENFNETNNTFIDVSAGLGWRMASEDSRSNVIFGAGLFHLNRPTQSFNDDADSKLPMRITANSMGIIQVHPKWDFVLGVLGQIQGPYEQLLAMTGGRYHISQARGKEIALQLGTSYRFGDAIIPNIQLHYAAWQVGVSYDINISAFDTATNGNGGLEIGAIYTITNVKPVEVFESCPVF